MATYSDNLQESHQQVPANLPPPAPVQVCGEALGAGLATALGHQGMQCLINSPADVRVEAQDVPVHQEQAVLQDHT